MVTDVCVPISNLTEIILKTEEDIKESGILGMLNVLLKFYLLV